MSRHPSISQAMKDSITLSDAGLSDEDKARAELEKAGLVKPQHAHVQRVDTMTAGPVGARSVFAELMADPDAYMVEGFSLEKQKTNLIGVPFAITSVTFRDGVARKGPNGPELTNYISAEAYLADRHTLMNLVTKGRLSAEVASRIIPDEPVVINDGSTGVCRQIVAILHQRGLITVPDGPEGGETSASRYDTYRASWVKGYDPDDPNPRFNVKIICPRGLRVSEYTNAYGEADTFYLA